MVHCRCLRLTVIGSSLTNLTWYNIWICSLYHEAIASRQHKSTSGHIYTLASGAISWWSRLHRIVALSTTKAEYISPTKASKGAIWLAHFCSEFGMPEKAPDNSQSAIYLGKNAMFHAHTKHIDVRYHFIKEVLEDGLITLIKVNTSQNPTDALTKYLPEAQHQLCIQMVGASLFL